MAAHVSKSCCLALVAAVLALYWPSDSSARGRPASAAPATASATDPGQSLRERYASYSIADINAPGVLMGGPPPGMAKAAGDTVYLYGGPGRYPGDPGYSLEGRFQTAAGLPDRQGWQGVDLTEVPSHWHIDTFNCANLSTAAPPYWIGVFAVPDTNHAMWAGLPAGTLGYATAPGYGNNWIDQVDRRWTISNATQSTTITWDFEDNHDSEPTYDFIFVQWDSAGSMKSLLSFDASNKDSSGNFVTPHFVHAVVTYHSTDYVGPSSNQVHLRVTFESDGAWSDEDGLGNTDGAVQVDNIQVSGTNGVGLNQADFESGDGGWVGVPGDFAGDFSKVFARLTDLDPCGENASPQMTFIDDGTPPNNDPDQRSTGGSLSPTWHYGIPGGWVVSYTGGLTVGPKPIANEVWSPIISWDQPGTADDGIEGGAILRYWYWNHLPPSNGLFALWHVRSRPDLATGGWSEWRDRGFNYSSGSAFYREVAPLVRDLLVPAPAQVQIALGVVDLADAFSYPGNDATASPYFDNVAFLKYDAYGPGLVAREIDLLNDGFPTSGTLACAGADDTPLAIRLDMARDIRASAVPANVPGDSIICDFVARKPGSSVDPNSIRMEFVLVANPCFDAERAGGIAALQAGAGAGASDVQQTAGNRWHGYVKGKQSYTSGGGLVANRYYFDLPDGPLRLATYQQPNEPALFFPGDELRYYLTASTVNPSETALLPADTSGFGRGRWYNRVFTVRGLPTLTCGVTDTDPCTQPSVLVWNDAPDRGNVDELTYAFSQNGLRVMADYDLYKTNGPFSLVGNGLGSAGAHGATAAQLAGYSCLFYDAAQLTSGLICDGSLSSALSDKSRDVQAITGWEGQAGHRTAAYFGDDIGFAERVGQQITFRNNILGLSVVGTDVRGSIGNQTVPKVGPTGSVPGFSQQFVAYGGCLAINVFDNINPLSGSGALKAHEFLGLGGQPGAYAPAASVYYARSEVVGGQSYQRTNVTFPYGFMYIEDALSKTGGRSARTELIRELLMMFGHGDLIDDGDAVATEPATPRQLGVSLPHPNPFNPATTIQLSVPARGHVKARIYNLRGELVVTLLDELVDPGPRVLVWRGLDARGHDVASGLYVCRISGFGSEHTLKLALLK